MNFKTNLITTLILIIFATAHAAAENYPYRSDYLWVTTPDHDNWTYRCGEKAQVEIQLYRYGIPCSTDITWTLADDLLTPDKKGTLKTVNGRAKLNIGTRKTPGFRDLTLNAVIDGQKTSHHIKLAFSPEKIQPYTREPEDFTAFWQQQLETLKKTKLQYTRERATEYCTDRILCDLIKLRIDDRHYIYAYLTYPRNAQPGSCPAVICPPGAGIKTIKEPLRHVYLSLVRAVEFMASLPEWDGRNMAMQGGSQGGALALVAAALSPQVTHAIANHPALSDMAAYAQPGRTGGYPHFNRINGMMTPEKIRTMAYYDVVNFARHITCPVFMTWGFNDNTCPPTTSYAVFNTISAQKTPLVTPVNEHWTSDATELHLMHWLKQNLLAP